MSYSNPFSFRESFFGPGKGKNNRYINQLFPRLNRVWGQKTAVWVDTGDAFALYVSIPELRAVINKRASMMSLNVPRLMDKDGVEITDHWMNALIKKPNPTQSWSDVIFSLSVNDALWSSAFAYAPKRSFDIRNLMLPLPSDKVKINLTGNKLKQMDGKGLVENFTFCFDTDIETLDFDDVVYFTTPDGVNIIAPSSRLDALRFPLSNIKASYHKRNVLLENIGAIGILTAKNNDISGAIPMDPDEKKQIQRDWYARSKDELIITESDVSWQAMSFPTKDLLLFEELTADKMALVDAYGLSHHIFSQEKGATFANVRDGIRMSYNDTIIPETQAMYDAITEQFGLDEDGLRLVADFSQIPVLQADMLLKANAFNRTAAGVKALVEAGIDIDEEEVRKILGLDKS